MVFFNICRSAKPRPKVTILREVLGQNGDCSCNLYFVRLEGDYNYCLSRFRFHVYEKQASKQTVDRYTSHTQINKSVKMSDHSHE